MEIKYGEFLVYPHIFHARNIWSNMKVKDEYHREKLNSQGPCHGQSLEYENEICTSRNNLTHPDKEQAIMKY